MSSLRSCLRLNRESCTSFMHHCVYRFVISLWAQAVSVGKSTQTAENHIEDDARYGTDTYGQLFIYHV